MESVDFPRLSEVLCNITNLRPPILALMDSNSCQVYKGTYNVTALFDNVFTILEYIDSCETSSPIIYKKGRKGNDIKSGTAEYT